MSSNDQLPPGWSAEWFVPSITTADRRDLHLKPQECRAPTIHLHRYIEPQKYPSASYKAFLENSTAHRQWEHPEQYPDIEGPLPSTPAHAHHPKRRQYAASQSEAYTGASTPTSNTSFHPQNHQQADSPQIFTQGAPYGSPPHSQQQHQSGYYAQAPTSTGFPRSPAGYERGHGRQDSVAVDQLAGQFQQMNVSQPSYGQQPVRRPSQMRNVFCRIWLTS